MNFLVEFMPKTVSKMAAELRISVVNNPFEDNVIQLIGEGYKESVTIDNIHCHDNMTSQLQLRCSSAIEFDGDEVISKFRTVVVPHIHIFQPVVIRGVEGTPYRKLNFPIFNFGEFIRRFCQI